jgi:hypothetical protein
MGCAVGAGFSRPHHFDSIHATRRTRPPLPLGEGSGVRSAISLPASVMGMHRRARYYLALQPVLTSRLRGEAPSGRGAPGELLRASGFQPHSAMAYSTAEDRVYLFGGQAGYIYVGETWTYDLITNTWTNVTPHR